MDEMEDRIINSYKNAIDFSDIPQKELQNYINKKHDYPVGAIILVVTMYTTSSMPHAIDLNYFLSILSYIYENIYTETEQYIIANFLYLYTNNMIGKGNMVMNKIESLLSLSSNKVEIQKIQIIFKYNYLRLLMSSHSPNKNKIKELLDELESSVQSSVFFDLLHFRET